PLPAERAPLLGHGSDAGGDEASMPSAKAGVTMMATASSSATTDVTFFMMHRLVAHTGATPPSCSEHRASGHAEDAGMRIESENVASRSLRRRPASCGMVGLSTREATMAKNGFKLLDSDMHIIEPPDLWERYIDPAFKAQAPRGWPGAENPSVLEVAGTVMPRIAATPRAHYQTMYARKADRYRRAIERQYDSQSQLEAMDIEGIDVAVLFPTRGLYALA